MTGSGGSALTGNDYETIAYDGATGTPLWEKAFDGHSHGGSDAAWAIGTSPDGSSVYVSGSAYIDGTGNDYATVAYAAASGALLWVARAGGAQEDFANALAVDPIGGKIFVTGGYSSTPSHTRDYGTIAYQG